MRPLSETPASASRTIAPAVPAPRPAEPQSTPSSTVVITGGDSIPIEATVDGRPIRLGATKQRAVLAMLALSPNRTVSVDRLIEGLWGEEAPDSAAKMVQLYVSQLRKLLAGNGAES